MQIAKCQPNLQLNDVLYSWKADQMIKTLSSLVKISDKNKSHALELLRISGLKEKDVNTNASGNYTLLLETYSRTSRLNCFCLFPRNSPIICLLKPFLCSRKWATPTGVSGTKFRSIRYWMPFSGFLEKRGEREGGCKRQGVREWERKREGTQSKSAIISLLICPWWNAC